MSRLRRVDRAIIADSAHDVPLDSDDQEILISQLAAENNDSLKFALRILTFSALLEIPLSTYALARADAGGGSTVLLLVSHVMTLVLCVYELPRGWVRQYRSSPYLAPVMPAADLAVSFGGAASINAFVLAEAVYLATRSGLHLKHLYFVLPAVNLVAVILARSWHWSVAGDIDGLHDLKYKFKTA